MAILTSAYSELPSLLHNIRSFIHHIISEFVQECQVFFMKKENKQNYSENRSLQLARFLLGTTCPVKGKLVGLACNTPPGRLWRSIL
jgi:hypothetical protein